MGGTSTVNVNNLTAVHTQSSGISTAEPPDVCLTPTPQGSVMPMPYPNVAQSLDLVNGSMSVMADGTPVSLRDSQFIKSTGDEPGVVGGVTSATVMGPAQPMSYSFDVFIEGQPVCRLTDKMTMNNRNTLTSGGVMQPPLPPATPPNVCLPDPSSPKVCSYRNLTVRCSHGDRNYTAESERGPSRISVIASEKPEKLEFVYGGDCAVHSASCGRVRVVASSGEEVPVSAGSVELKLDKNSLAEVNDWYEALRALLNWDGLPRRTYTVAGTTCEGTATEQFDAGDFVLVDVYPAFALNGSVSFGYQHKAAKTPVKGKGGQSLLYQLEKQATWSLGGSVEAQYGVRKFKQDFANLTGLDDDKRQGAKADSDPLSRKLFSFTQGTLNKLANMLDSFSGLESTKFEVRWPKLTMAASLKLAEVKQKPDVVLEGRFSIGAEPLIGAQVQLDILDWLIMATASGLGGPPGAVLGRLLVKAKARLKEGKDPQRIKVEGKDELQDKMLPAGLKADLGIVFSMGGDIGGALGWVCDVDGVHPDGDKAKIEAGIDFKLEAFVKAELSIFIVRAAAGASIGIKSADGKGPSRIAGVVRPNPATITSKKRGPHGNYFNLVGQIEFNGLAIHYALYAEIGGNGNEAAPKPAAGATPSSTDAEKKKPNPYKKQLSKIKKEHKEEASLCTILEPFVWPKPSESDVLRAT